jgi:hypothetical protein
VVVIFVVLEYLRVSLKCGKRVNKSSKSRYFGETTRAVLLRAPFPSRTWDLHTFRVLGDIHTYIL